MMLMKDGMIYKQKEIKLKEKALKSINKSLRQIKEDKTISLEVVEKEYEL